MPSFQPCGSARRLEHSLQIGFFDIIFHEALLDVSTHITVAYSGTRHWFPATSSQEHATVDRQPGASIWELPHGGLHLGVPIWRPPCGSSHMKAPYGSSNMEASTWELPDGSLRRGAPTRRVPGGGFHMEASELGRPYGGLNMGAPTWRPP